MRPLASACLLGLLAACTGKATPLPTDDTGAAGDDGADGGSGDGGDDGGGGTDADGDGFTVEDGDCDDSDIGVNPAREEDVFDGVDNDCDGRVDEEWAGLVVTQQAAAGRSSLLVLDTIARVEDEVQLPDGVTPYDVEHGLDGGWVIVSTDVFINFSAGTPSFEYAPVEVLTVAEDGSTATLATFTDPAYEDGGDPAEQKFYWFGPIARGLTAHPGGYYVIATPGALWRVDPDGTTTELASWAWDIGDDTTYQLYALDLSVDLLTGEVGIMGLLGGFATWSEADGLVIHKQADLADGWSNWDAKLGVGLSRMDGDGWFGMVGDLETGEYTLSRFNHNDGDWAVRMEWANNLVMPIDVATDGDHGEVYVTAKGGDHRTIWRIREQGELVDDALDEVEDGYNLWGIVSRY